MPEGIKFNLGKKRGSTLSVSVFVCPKLHIFSHLTDKHFVTFVMTYSAVLPCGYTSCIFCEIRWRIAVNKVQTCFSAHTARTAALRHRKSIGIINSRALTSAYDLFSFPAILAVAFSESQYFSGTVDSKTRQQ